MRRNIFEIAKKNTSGFAALPFIFDLFEQYSTIAVPSGGDYPNCYNLFSFVDLHCFKKWKNKGLCSDLEEYLKILDYAGFCQSAIHYNDKDSLLTIIEVIYNCWYIPQWTGADDCHYTDSYFELQKIMDATLADFNYKIFVDNEAQKALVVEDVPGATKVSEIVSPALSMDVICYNSHSLKGSISEKEALLLRFSKDLEPKRPILENANDGLASAIFSLFNNLHLRHNNIDAPANNPNYHELVKNMSSDELEVWYDKLYQMILLAYLTLDNIKCVEEVRALNKEIKKKN